MAADTELETELDPDEVTMRKAMKAGKAYLVFFRDDVDGATIDACLARHGFRNGWPRMSSFDLHMVDGREWAREL